MFQEGLWRNWGHVKKIVKAQQSSKAQKFEARSSSNKKPELDDAPNPKVETKGRRTSLERSINESSDHVTRNFPMKTGFKIFMMW